MSNDFIPVRGITGWGNPDDNLINAGDIPLRAAQRDDTRGRRWVVAFHKRGAIAIVRNFNVHGMQSYGWVGDDKIIVTEARDIPELLFSDMIDAALREAARLNEAEKDNGK